MGPPNCFRSVDVVVVGGGLAGLMTALSFDADVSVALVTKDALLESNSSYAQGGIAAALDGGASVEQHIKDTILAGRGHCNERVVRTCIDGGASVIEHLVNLGVQFDRDESGAFALGKEGGHSQRRILHAGDATGRAIVEPLAKLVRDKNNISIFEHTTVCELLQRNGFIEGVFAIKADHTALELFGRHVVLATGGSGQVFARTTNPNVATGDGVALALAAGVTVKDLEFYQFHPTCLAVKGSPVSLMTEALRGEGALLISKDGRRFMKDLHSDGELAPRDVVARAIFNELRTTGFEHVLMDISHHSEAFLRARFPNAFSLCAAAGLRLPVDPIPIAPAAHYQCGGIAVDGEGRTSLTNLWAVGEVACTGLHGANRLASNSLLEAAVFVKNLARTIAESIPKDAPTKTPISLRSESRCVASAAAREAHACLVEKFRTQVQEVMWANVGIERHAPGMIETQKVLGGVHGWIGSLLRDFGYCRPWFELLSMTLVSLELTRCALERTHSLGVHQRGDEKNTFVS